MVFIKITFFMIFKNSSFNNYYSNISLTNNCRYISNLKIYSFIILSSSNNISIYLINNTYHI